ncbi:RHS repeat-associated core domain-containing protein [Chryseobacterium oryctis]|uniref:RHS repeat-associated core domain-containing protein n=1 Tax=Chryseobacterium oryctis TaxID=2952618 RepID=A0ABT3HSL9_9FLAO|nr:RHS repeat-associated core domain-containing protein [Chryseobacterium oryctis]MCW3162628.1 hypothetical protein [Chryseobacterium oryctis]
MLDYGWRQYMPDLGRWNGIDQLAEKYDSTSPFAYVVNSPISLIDPDGRWIDDAGNITDTSGQTYGFLGSSFKPKYATNFLGVNYGDGGGGYSGGYTFTGNDAASMFEYFANGGSMDGLSFNKGFAMWSTLDDANRNMYYDIDDMLTGNTGGITLHRAKVNTPFDAYKNWADWGATAMGGGFEYVAKQRTALYNSGYWIDNLGQMRSTAYAGRARGSLIGLRSDYLRNTEMFGKYAKRAGYVGYAISAAQISYGTYKDGGNFGIRAKIATANVVGGTAGAWLGTKAGALAGGELGAMIGVWFEGVGAIPGAAIGGIVGGVVGGILGGVYGGDYAEEWASKILNKPDYIK